MGLKENGEVGRRTLEINDGAQCLAHSNCSKNGKCHYDSIHYSTDEENKPQRSSVIYPRSHS